MELHAIWNRIDQLEQLILSQAKDIDTLRRALNAAQITIQKCLPNGADPTTGRRHCLTAVARYHDNPMKPQQLTTACTAYGRAPPGDRFSSLLAAAPPATTTRSRFDGVERPGRMELNTIANRNFSSITNSVHPVNAIPPIARQVVLSSSMHTHQPPDRTRRFGSEGPGSRGPMSGIAADGSNSMTLPANARWSTGPSLLGPLVDIERDSDHGRSKAPKRRCFNLIELFTCFCPCFNMC
jgi:hypothetical protein